MTKIFLEKSERYVCPSCFGNPTTSAKAKKIREQNSQYRVVNNLSENLISDDWTAHEELLLIEAFQTRGFGNWNDISEKVATKSREECELHYMKVNFHSYF